MTTTVTTQLPVQRIAATFAAADANRDTRTVPMTFYTGASIQQFTWERGDHKLTLSMDPAHVRLGLLNSGRAPFTKGHADTNDPGATLGVIENARIDAGKGRASVRFSKRPDVEPIYNDILDGVLANVSVGARVFKLEETTRKGEDMRSFTATDWEPYHVALVGVGADVDAHFADMQLSECTIIERTGESMNTDTTTTTASASLAGAVTTNAGELAGLVKFAATNNLTDVVAGEIAKGSTVDVIRTSMLNHMADRQGEPIRGVRAAPQFGRDHRDGLVAAMAEALACRYTNQQPSDRAREYMGATVSDMARICCEAAGVHATGFGSERYIKLAMHGTTDFPHLTTEAGNRMLLAAYAAATPAIKAIARRSSAPDFRTKSALRLGGAPTLVKVPQNGEITYGSRAESAESYRLYSFARIFAITREAFINDDLSAFSDWARSFGQAAANLEAQELVDLLYGAGGLGPAMSNTLTLFHATHGNLNAAPGVISDTTLTAARLAMRTATDLDGVTVIETSPRYLVVPAAQEGAAEKFLAPLYPAQAANVNPFSSKLEMIVEPRLDAKSATVWYLFGEPAQSAPVLEYSHLNDAGPQIDSRLGFDVLGMEFRCVLDYGTGAIGWRGCYKGNN